MISQLAMASSLDSGAVYFIFPKIFLQINSLLCSASKLAQVNLHAVQPTIARVMSRGSIKLKRSKMRPEKPYNFLMKNRHTVVQIFNSNA